MTDTTDDLNALVQDHALGLSTPSEAILMEELLARDPVLAAMVGDLRDRLLPLDLSAPPQVLPAQFRETLRDRLGRQIPAVGAANLATALRRRNLGLLAASIVGLCVGFAGAALRPVPDPQVVAVLLDAEGVPQAVIDDYGDDTATVRFVADIAVPADRSLQVWTLPSAQMGATSLGTLDRAGPALLRFGDLPDPLAQQLYEVTLEPLGGSPTGRPTGPIIGKGFAAPQG